MSMNDDRERWNAIANHWHQRQGLFGDPNRAQLNQMILDLCGDMSGKLTLDAGCGTGPFTRFLGANTDCELVGLDFAERLISIAAGIALKGVTRRIRYTVSDLCYMPFVDNVFDVIVANFSLSDLPCLDGALGEIARVGKSGCRFVLSVVHPVAMLEAIEKARRPIHSRMGPVHSALRVQDYFGREHDLYYWTDTFATRVYHRTIEEYFMKTTGAGFRITGLLEPNLSLRRDSLDSPHDKLTYPRFLVLAGNLVL